MLKILIKILTIILLIFQILSQMKSYRADITVVICNNTTIIEMNPSPGYAIIISNQEKKSIQETTVFEHSRRKNT